MAGRLGNAAFPAWHIEVRTMKRSKMTAAKNSLSPTMKSRAQTKHAIQGEEALAEWAPRLSAANAQKLVRLVRNCGIETVIGVAPTASTFPRCRGRRSQPSWLSCARAKTYPRGRLSSQF